MEVYLSKNLDSRLRGNDADEGVRVAVTDKRQAGTLILRDGARRPDLPQTSGDAYPT